MAKKSKFPSTSIELLMALHIGLRSSESEFNYLVRISAKTHRNTDHKFTSSPEIPGQCICGWVDSSLMCSDSECSDSMREHLLLAAALCDPDETFADFVIVIEIRDGRLD